MNNQNVNPLSELKGLLLFCALGALFASPIIANYLFDDQMITAVSAIPLTLVFRYLVTRG